MHRQEEDMCQAPMCRPIRDIGLPPGPAWHWRFPVLRRRVANATRPEDMWAIFNACYSSGNNFLRTCWDLMYILEEAVRRGFHTHPQFADLRQKMSYSTRCLSARQFCRLPTDAETDPITDEESSETWDRTLSLTLGVSGDDALPLEVEEAREINRGYWLCWRTVIEREDPRLAERLQACEEVGGGRPVL